MTTTRTAEVIDARSIAMPLERAEHRCVPGLVTAVADVAPWLRRLTLQVPGLAGYAVLGPDEFVGLVMPRPGTALPDLGAITGPNPRPVIGALPEDVRPDVRWYTVRAWRPESCELDIEVVLHPAGEVDEGPGARWVRAAAPGAPVAVQTGTTCYHPPADARAQLVVGDETAYPAIAGIIEAARGTDRELHVILSQGREGALPPLARPERGSLTVVPTAGTELVPRMLAAVAASGLAPGDLDYAWACGEQELAAQVRRHVVQQLGLAKTSVYFCAYWIEGRPRG